MRILFINNDGGGFATHIEVDAGTTVAQLFDKQLPGRDAGDYLIRVDRQPVSAEQVLQDGQRCSFTPVKIEGAAAFAVGVRAAAPPADHLPRAA